MEVKNCRGMLFFQWPLNSHKSAVWLASSWRFRFLSMINFLRAEWEAPKTTRNAGARVFRNLSVSIAFKQKKAWFPAWLSRQSCPGTVKWQRSLDVMTSHWKKKIGGGARAVAVAPSIHFRSGHWWALTLIDSWFVPAAEHNKSPPVPVRVFLTHSLHQEKKVFSSILLQFLRPPALLPSSPSFTLGTPVPRLPRQLVRPPEMDEVSARHRTRTWRKHRCCRIPTASHTAASLSVTPVTSSPEGSMESQMQANRPSKGLRETKRNKKKKDMICLILVPHYPF